MKKKLFIVSLVLSMCFSMLSIVNVQAKETIREDHYVNPIYKDVKSSVVHHDIQTYSLEDVEYTSDQEKLVKIFREKLINRESNIVLYYHCDEEITQEFFSNLVHQLFQKAIKHTGNGKEGDYLKWHCQGWTVKVNTSGNSNEGYDLNIFYDVSYLSSLEQEEKVDEEVSNLLKSLDLSNKTDYQKVKAIYDYISSNVTYDHDNLNDESYSLKYTAYAALINKTAVCQGYASLFYRLALDAGVDTRVISGEAGGPHAWNIVKLNGKYYNLDSTWDAGRSTYAYFLKNTNDFDDHVRDNDYQSNDFIEEYPMWDKSYTEAENQYLDYEYEINDKNQVIITKYTGSDENVVTPTIIDNKPVVGIGHYTFISNQNLKTITVSEGIEFLEGILVGSCPNLKQINLPSTLNMGNYEGNVFSGCNGLVDYCPQLEEITVAPNNPYLCVDDEILYTKNKSVVISSATKHNFGDLILPNTVTYINDEAFAYNDTLTSIQIPDGVTYIGYWAFDNCNYLEKTNIPRSIELIGQYAFHQTSLKSLFIPKEVGGVGICGDRFTNYWQSEPIQKITVEEGNTYYKIVDGALIHDNCLLMYEGGNKQKSYIMPNYITKIASYAFNRAENLEKITLSNKLEEISYSSFMDCINLEQVYIPEGIKRIEDSSFWGCENLKKVYFPKSLIEIEDYVFANVHSITDIYYAGSKEQWEQLPKGNTFSEITPTYHYDYDECSEFGHNYDQPIYTWSSDNQTVTAKRICLNNGLHIEEETVTAQKIVKDPTCTENGIITYIANFKNNAFKSQTKIVDDKKATGHKVVVDQGKKATCKEDGLTEGKHCSVCNEVIKKQEVIPATGHKVVVDQAKEATCTENGLTEGSHCSVCNEVIKKQEVIPSTGHKEVLDSAKEATCTNTGLTEGIHCSICNKIIKKQEIIPALGHDFKDGVCTRCHNQLKGQWKQSGNKWWYQYEDGTYPKNEFIAIDNKLYRFDQYGYMKTGWFKVNGTDYYASTSGEIKAQWVGSGNNWYYVDADGKMVTGFQTISGVKYYFETNGLMKKGWFKVNNEDYYASTSGEIKAQWVGSGNTWYYVDADGKMLTGYQTISGAKYYFAESGLMQTGWFKIDNADYYAASSGVITAQWVGSGNTWYYVDADGKMVTGHQTIAGAKYYFAESGLMQTGWFKINGEDYYAASSGAISAQWVKSGNNWYYVDANGKMVTGDYAINGEVNRFDANGVWHGVWLG